MKVPERAYRPEIHGVRGLAIFGVVLFHIFGAGRISGGVDIFLAVSGFLFTAMLLREATERDGQIDLPRYFSRIFRRLLPPAILVISATVALGLWLFPSTRYPQLLAEARASLLYFENVELINSQLSYDAAGPESSPFQHFWSLSVQGQFYLVWPVIAVIAVFLAKKLRRSPALMMTILVGLVLVASFIYAIYMGAMSQDVAYLMTRTRLWELAFGGLLALLVTHIRLPQKLRDVLGWLGIALVISCGFVLDGAALFPGVWTLWPLLGLTLVILSSQPDTRDYERRGTAAHLMSTAPLGWLGTLAYSLYLWHWPLLIFYIEFRGYEGVGLRGGLVVLAVSLTVAWLTYRIVERPVSNAPRRGRWRPLLIGSGGLLVGGGALTAGVAAMTVQIPEGEFMSGVDQDQYPGAAAIEENTWQYREGADYYPDLAVLAESSPAYYSWGCRQSQGDDAGTGKVLVCEDPNAPANPRARVMLAGGSHAGQWHPAFVLLAEKNGWELLVADKSGCRFGSINDPENNKCDEWNQGFKDVVEEWEPDVVVTPGSLLFYEESETIAEDAPDRWDEIIAAGAELLLLRGTARPGSDVPECLAAGRTGESCGADFSLFQSENPLAEVATQPGIYTVDMSDQICPDENCPAIIGDVAVYWDRSHMSPYYVETLAPILESRLREEMPELFR